MYTTTRIIDFGPPLGPAKPYVRYNHKYSQGQFLPREEIGRKLDIEPITFQTLGGRPGVWLIDVLYGMAEIESPDTEFDGIQEREMLSWNIRVCTWPGYSHISVGYTETESAHNVSTRSLTRFRILKSTAELICQFMESAMEVGPDSDASPTGWWTIGKNGIDIEHIRIMSLDWRDDGGAVLVPRIWIAGM